MLDRPKLEEVVISIAKSLYKVEPKIIRYSLRDSSVWGLEFDDGRADRVIKLDINRPTSLSRERQVMKRLQEAGFPIPEIEFTQADLSEVWISFMTMPKIANNLTLRGAYNSDRGLMLKGCQQTGEFLARLHQFPVEKMKINPSFLLSAEGFGENLMAAEIDLRQINHSLNYLNNLKDAPQCKKNVLQSLNRLKKIIVGNDQQEVTHRDFVPTQILIGDRDFSVIDWEFAAAGRACRDLGDFIAALRRFIDDDLYIRAFIDSYHNIRALSTEDIVEIGLWETFSMVRKARLNSLSKKQQVARKLFNLAGETTFASQYRWAS